MKIKSILLLIFVAGFALMAVAQEKKCDVCGKPIVRDYFYSKNMVTFETNYICNLCEKLPNKCFSCGLPVVDETAKKLPDGRFLCPACAAESVGSDDEAREICRQTVQGLDRLLGRSMEFPVTNSIVTILNNFNMGNLRHAAASQHICATTAGLTSSNPMHDGTMIHNISILSDMSRSRLMAVCAHEYTHAFMGQNHIRENRKKRMNEIMEEGFCELVAHKYAESRGDTLAMKYIENNNYTEGKITVMLAADAKYGFDTVLDWVKYGEDAELYPDHLDRVRAIEGTAAPAAEAATDYASLIPVAAPGARQYAPTNLVLKSISGSGNRRFAMINSTTFERMEKEKVRLATGSVEVQCLEITGESVTITVDGSAEKKKLFLKGN